MEHTQPFSFSFKVEQDGTISETFTAWGASPEELAAHIDQLRATVQAHRVKAPAPAAATRPVTSAQRPQTPTPIRQAQAPQQQAQGQKPLTMCPDCGKPAEFVVWTSGTGEHKALVCRPCNVWVNRKQDGTVTTKAATGPLPTKEKRQSQPDDEALPF